MEGSRNFALRSTQKTTTSAALWMKKRAVVIGSMILNLILLIIIVVLLIDVLREKNCKVDSVATNNLCPEDWIGHQKKCYYFSNSEKNWSSCHEHCVSYGASLAVIDSQEEMSFLLRHKSLPDHWIGLRRNNSLQPWKWMDGTFLHETFTVHGGGKCAYLNHDSIASSSCTREEHWVCSKVVT